MRPAMLLGSETETLGRDGDTRERQEVELEEAEREGRRFSLGRTRMESSRGGARIRSQTQVVWTCPEEGQRRTPRMELQEGRPRGRNTKFPVFTLLFLRLQR